MTIVNQNIVARHTEESKGPILTMSRDKEKIKAFQRRKKARKARALAILESSQQAYATAL
ncbi:hypothetical protein [Vibrio splendidus]|uniref:hypothetical protein n=1 Tax=Vibrio splendidus TaxID=29497 RepID=UPI000C851660|nr:hypothetical protein [Vibrio splendidus]PMI53417.1 hypothetical protein BCU42_21260 [Vibrio splendidus]